MHLPLTSKKNTTIAITGANGFLGSTLVTHFTARGYRVIALVRGAHRYQDKTNVSYREYSLDKVVEPSQLKSADYLIHAAYVKLDRSHPDAIQINIEGAKNIIAASRQLGIKKNIFISSMSAHNEAVSAYGRQKMEIEKLFNTKHDVNVRPGLIIGRGGIVKSMTDFMRSKHIVPIIGGGKQPLQIIGVRQLAQALENILLTNIYGTLTIAYPEVYSYIDFYKILSQHLRVRVLLIPVPFSLLLSTLKILKFLHVPLNINDDNLLGLKMLRSTDTKPDILKLGLDLKSLRETLKIEEVS